MAFLDFFVSYLKLGFHHIVDINGYDHILFILSLCAVYKPSDWKKVGILITAFTLGHSVTLALASLKIILPNRYIIELLIPVTILSSCVYNLFTYRREDKTKLYVKYLLALCFGFIHGMSFSSYFSLILGDMENLLLPLFSFNVGIEVGQLFIIAVYYLLYIAVVKLTNLAHNKFVFVFSGIGIIASLYLIIVRF